MDPRDPHDPPPFNPDDPGQSPPAESGNPYTDPVFKPNAGYNDPPPPYDPGDINIDVACINCGYNLRGLTIDMACPECGTAVGRSIQGDHLQFANPDWVSKLALGMNLIVAGIAINIVLAVAGAAYGMSTGARNTGPGTGAGMGGSTALEMLGLGVGLLFIVGYWLITEREPSGREDGASLRQVARFGLIGAYVLEVGGTILMYAQLSATQIPITGIVVTIIAGIVSIVGTVALALYAQRLAMRIPNERLASQIRVVMIGYAVGLGLVIMATIIIAASAMGAAGTGGGMGGLGAGGVCACIGGLDIIVFGIWALVLIIWFRREMAGAAAAARSTWASSY